MILIQVPNILFQLQPKMLERLVFNFSCNPEIFHSSSPQHISQAYYESKGKIVFVQLETLALAPHKELS